MKDLMVNDAWAEASAASNPKNKKFSAIRVGNFNITAGVNSYKEGTIVKGQVVISSTFFGGKFEEGKMNLIIQDLSNHIVQYLEDKMQKEAKESSRFEFIAFKNATNSKKDSPNLNKLKE